MADIIQLLISLVIQTIVLSPVLWFVGRKIADPKDVKFTDAIWIVVLGNIIALVIGYLGVGGIVAAIVNLIVWLLLVQHFFDTGWLRAVAISVITVIIFVIVAVILAFVGIGIALLA